MNKFCISSVLAAISLALSSPAQSDTNTLVSVGDVLQVASPVIASYSAKQINGNKGMYACVDAWIQNTIITQAVKFAVNAPRPNGGDRGFPSGHTSGAAVGFGCSLAQEGVSLTSVSLGAASALTGYSRMKGEYHTVEQVIAGFALGTAIGYLNGSELKDEKQYWSYNITTEGSHLIGFNFKF